MQAEFLDRLSRRQSAVHRLTGRVKTALAAALVVSVVATPIRFWPLYIVEAALVLAAYFAARLPARYLLVRLLAAAPLLVLLAIGVPLSRGLVDGWELAAQIVIRGLLCLATMLTLLTTTPFSDLLEVLSSLRVPRILIWVLAFMYRYLFVLLDELERMRRAKLARTFDKPRCSEIRSIASFIGILCLRSCARSERVHMAMCARGWNGRFSTSDDQP